MFLFNFALSFRRKPAAKRKILEEPPASAKNIPRFKKLKDNDYLDVSSDAAAAESTDEFVTQKKNMVVPGNGKNW